MAESATAAFDADLAQLTELDIDALRSLEDRLVEAFDSADQAGDEVSITALADALDDVRDEIEKRGEGSDSDDSTELVASGEEPSAVDTPNEQPVEEPAAEPAEVPADDAAGEADTPAADGEGAVEEQGNEESSDQEEEDDNEKKEGKAVTAATAQVEVPEGREPVSRKLSTVVAGADIPGFSAGVEIQSGEEFGKALAARINTLNRLSGGDGEQVVVASIRNQAPEDRTLHMGDPEGNREKIKALTDQDALVAAGGFCAPLTTRYDLFDCGGTADRPVRDSLAGFQADRGGIRFYRPSSLADLAPGIGFWTNQDDIDAADDTVEGPVKACVRVDCPPEETAEIQAVTMCLTFGVGQSRVFPELAVRNNELAMVAQARLSEAALLAQIKAGSTAIADTGTPLGAVRDLLDVVGRAAVYYRDRYRLARNAPMRAVFPSWVLELLRGDIAQGLPVGSFTETFGMTDEEITSWFSRRNINITWALDTAVPGTNGGGLFDGTAITAFPAWQSSVEWALYPEGSWLYLDGGTLDLGIVRDSSLIRVNDYQQFAETFEAAANVGCESFWVTSAVNVSGVYNGPTPNPYTPPVTP